MEDDGCRYFGFYNKLNLAMTGIILALVGVNRALALYDHALGIKLKMCISNPLFGKPKCVWED